MINVNLLSKLDNFYQIISTQGKIMHIAYRASRRLPIISTFPIAKCFYFKYN